MEMICMDEAFGEMIYKHRWYKKQQIELFGKSWLITIAAKAYLNKSITRAQREAYEIFLKKEKFYLSLVEKQLKRYINDNVQEWAVYWQDARHVDSINELAEMVTPTTLLFKQDGEAIILLDCVWDLDHGVAVELFPSVAVGPQDLFL